MKDKLTVTFVKNSGFATVGYTATYPKDQAEALIKKGVAKLAETKQDRAIKTVEKTALGGRITKLTKDGGSD